MCTGKSIQTRCSACALAGPRPDPPLCWLPAPHSGPAPRPSPAPGPAPHPRPVLHPRPALHPRGAWTRRELRAELAAPRARTPRPRWSLRLERLGRKDGRLDDGGGGGGGHRGSRGCGGGGAGRGHRDRRGSSARAATGKSRRAGACLVAGVGPRGL